MTRTTITLLCLLAGCAYTPQEMRQEGERFTYALKLPPAEAALCIRRALDARPGAEPHERALGAGRELLIRITGTGLYSAIVEVMPRGTGSEATVWMTPNLLYDRAGLLALIGESGC